MAAVCIGKESEHRLNQIAECGRLFWSKVHGHSDAVHDFRIGVKMLTARTRLYDRKLMESLLDRFFSVEVALALAEPKYAAGTKCDAVIPAQMRHIDQMRASRRRE